MSIESEKFEVHRLRFEEGLTLKQISDQLGKSIYWVNARLDPKYQPKRGRKIAADDNNIEFPKDLENQEISNELKEIIDLRKQGLSYEEIAAKFGKSIYWVHTRLRDSYRPKAKRKIAVDDFNIINLSENEDQDLSDEIDKIIDLRKQGLSYEKIADKLNRSVYWVHTRLREEYTPKGSRVEKKFQEERVVPFLKSIGHLDIQQYVRIEGEEYNQEADIVSTFERSIFITEVKVHITHHQLQTAIGQLILHRMAFPPDNIPKIQIALPSEAKRIKLPETLVKLLKDIENIDILFIP